MRLLISLRSLQDETPEGDAICVVASTAMKGFRAKSHDYSNSRSLLDQMVDENGSESAGQGYQ